jgi:hypothetical protein
MEEAEKTNLDPSSYKPESNPEESEKQKDIKILRVKDEVGRMVFAPGVSGNPKGRPKGKSLKEFAREFLKNLPDEEKAAYLATLPKEIVWKMAEGNPAQDMTTGGEKINIVPIYGGISVQKHDGNQEDLPAEEQN